MSEHERYKNKDSFSNAVPETTATLKQMQYQLNAIERKLDSLLKQPGARDFRNRGSSISYADQVKSKRPFKSKHAKRKAEASGEGKFYHKLKIAPRKNSSKRNFRSNKQ